ncbi:hypothetical protein GGR56DRAFT_191603 [Xylariaceae sp. FL0804]|nr:hypothetical protein GGR56DRAFT_191603 [Xylariaceae sp. FL0804]
MTNGFEKLERLFGGSRRRERGRNKAAPRHKISVVRREPSSPVFPSPSYLRPTSMHMMPREAQIEASELEKRRSQSVPSHQEDLQRRSSVASSTTIIEAQQDDTDLDQRKYPRADSLRSSEVASELSRFRFPEDSLFKKVEPMPISAESRRQEQSTHKARDSRLIDASHDEGLLKWSPKHISLLFNPLEFEPSFINQHSAMKNDKTDTVMLLPSPAFHTSRPATTAGGSPKRLDPAMCSPPPSPKPKTKTKLSLFPRQRSFKVFRKPPIDSPPASDSDEDWAKISPLRSPTRSRSLSALSSPHSDLAQRSSEDVPQAQHATNPNRRCSIRETWGYRVGDPVLGDSPSRGGDSPRPFSSVRKSASLTTLVVGTSQEDNGETLTGPTFADFYDLTIEDIADGWPSPPIANGRTPSALSFQENRKPPGNRVSEDIAALSTNQLVSDNSSPRELSPPRTRANSLLLCPSPSTASPRNTLGAFWAAEIAKKYQLAVVYVVSLWPRSGKASLDLSRRSPYDPRPCLAQDYSVDAIEDVGSEGRHFSTSGRLLAAFGLHEVSVPFEIVTESHLNALSYDQWNEYRNHNAPPHDITRGWIRPFYADFVPVSSVEDGGKPLLKTYARNRGIVFAAYTKQSNHNTIPMKPSLEQNTALENLYFDAKALVDALIEDHPVDEWT